jgi:hypothetical protein
LALRQRYATRGSSTIKRLYSARIGESHSIAERIAYDVLLLRIMEFTIRSALARSVDESEWAHEELRREGLRSLQIFRDGRAVWIDGEMFVQERSAAQRQHDARFEQRNEFDPALYGRIDRDLCRHWRRAGYETSSLLYDMKKLFAELERDAVHCAARAREELLIELLDRS